MQIKKHSLNIFPEMNQDDYQLLIGDIKENGYDEDQPIVLYEGDILDGWNRYRACDELGIVFNTTIFDGSYNDALDFVLRTNKRRNLTSSQWATIAVEADDIFNRISERVEKERLKKQKENASNQHTEPSVKNFTQPKPERTSQKIADTFNTNYRYVSDAKKLKEEEPEAFERIKSGETNFSQLKKEQKKERLEQKKQEYEDRITSKESDSIDIFSTEKKYRVIYADPAWSYNDKQDTPNLGGANKHYQTMSTDKICELPINDISEKNSVLFLWVTSPLLPDGMRVISEWGYKYKSSFIWDKVDHNMGHYNSVRHEFLLIATKGSCTPDNKKLYDSVQSIKKSEIHSQKPTEFIDIIDDLYHHGDRIELFARRAYKKTWDFWGNEV